MEKEDAPRFTTNIEHGSPVLPARVALQKTIIPLFSMITLDNTHCPSENSYWQVLSITQF